MANDWNQKIIDEFRANQGRVGGNFEGHTLLLLHHTGARTGKVGVNPVAAQPISDNAWAIFASKGGAPTNPDWYYNLLANPEAEIEIGDQQVKVIAREATGEERNSIWEKQKEIMPGFADYEKKTSRTIPVIVLDRA